MEAHNDKKDNNLPYFMGRVETQLTQIHDILAEMRDGQKDIQVKLSSLEVRVGHLERDAVTHGWVREKLALPVTLGVVMFVLTVVVPGLIKLWATLSLLGGS
jgi:hypothetical protein